MASYIDISEPIITEFETTINRFIGNTIVFENHSHIERYINMDMENYRRSDLNLYYIDDIIINKFGNRLKEKATSVNLSDDQKMRWDMNPFLMAAESLGNISWWWTILFVNDMLNVHEFSNLPDTLKIPNMEDLKKCLVYEMFKNKDFGIIEHNS